MGKYRAPLANNDVIHLIEQNKEPEQKLWIAVLAKAFDDAFYSVEKHVNLQESNVIQSPGERNVTECKKDIRAV